MARFVLWGTGLPAGVSHEMRVLTGAPGQFVLWGTGLPAGVSHSMLAAVGAAPYVPIIYDEFDDPEDEIVLGDVIDDIFTGAPTEFIVEAALAADFIDEQATIESLLIFEALEASESITDTYGDGGLIEQAEASELIASQATFNEDLIEEVLVLIVDLEAESLTEAWLVNIKTNGISRYTWPDFNSFAFVNGKYYGAFGDGIFEIAGDTDDGQQIGMFVTDGKRELGSGQKKRVFAVYLDAETDGQVNLQVYADGQVYTYAFEVPPRNIAGKQLETLRASPGRGLRARNWVFEIQNVDGSDLDMSKLQIQPIVLDRRVR